jgi:UDP-glucose 4-epimerase
VPRYSTAEALADYGRSLAPVVRPELVEDVTSSAQTVLASVAGGVHAVHGALGSVAGGRRRAAPSVPGLRAVHDA